LKGRIDISRLASAPHIASVGDVMLDRYFQGSVERISPEAPIPVVEIDKVLDVLGGAANVMSNAAALGAKVWGFGVVGKDNEGQQVMRILSERGIDNKFLVKDKRRPTTLKCRVMVGHHQLMRYDIESREEVSKTIESRIISRINQVIGNVSFLAISDYDKGTMTPSLIEQLLKIASSHGVKIVVDPKLRHFHDYQGIDFAKTNLQNAQIVTGLKYSSISDAEPMMRRISNLLKCKNIILTMGKDGLSILSGTRFTHIPTLAREVYDVTGAGDVITAVLCVALASGYDLSPACRLASIAAAIKVSKVGTYSVSYDELIKSVGLYKDEMEA
jgi:rfaE bifunctional protein kinase chain/domain